MTEHTIGSELGPIDTLGIELHDGICICIWLVLGKILGSEDLEGDKDGSILGWLETPRAWCMHMIQCCTDGLILIPLTVGTKLGESIGEIETEGDEVGSILGWVEMVGASLHNSRGAVETQTAKYDCSYLLTT
eukprot:scaffold67198_cov50-Attheya_sp.AAC.2